MIIVLSAKLLVYVLKSRTLHHGRRKGVARGP